MDVVKLARDVAVIAHNDQRDKAGAPYIDHPFRVAAAMEPDERLMAIAWLHDTLEDSQITVDHLAFCGVPSSVIASVVHLTRVHGESYGDYIARLSDSGDTAAVLVKIADLIDNMRPGCPASLLRRYSRALHTLQAVAYRQLHST